jgi:DNA-binding MarR family transcriptional regulator
MTRGRAMVPEGCLTKRQLELLRAVEANPGGRLKDWGATLGVTTTSVHMTMHRLERAGLVKSIPLGKKSSRWVLTERAGCCPHCRRPMVSPSLEVVDGLKWKLDESAERAIAMSPGRTSAIARRFGVDPSHVRRIRKRAKTGGDSCRQA